MSNEPNIAYVLSISWLPLAEPWRITATIAAGGLSGGVASSMADGDFLDGLCNGLISSGLNHAMHLVVEEGPEWVYRLHKLLSVPKQIGDMDCKYAVMEAVAKSFGETEMTQSDFKMLGETFIKNNPDLTLPELFRLCGFSVAEPGSLSLQTLFEQMDRFDYPTGVEYMPSKGSHHIGVMTAFGIDSSNTYSDDRMKFVIQLSDPYFGDNHIVHAMNVDSYYQFYGYQSIPNMLNEPIKCLHYY